eukprot:9504998-Alexandrium_andersonii.AAC.1
MIQTKDGRAIAFPSDAAPAAGPTFSVPAIRQLGDGRRFRLISHLRRALRSRWNGSAGAAA